MRGRWFVPDSVAVPIIIIRMFVAPLPVFRLLFSLQLRGFSMGLMVSLPPLSVSTVFAVVPAMAIFMVAVVVAPIVFVLAVAIAFFGLNAHGGNQGRTQQKRDGATVFPKYAKIRF
jgi:hypothetical protein